jgi:ADP-ribose pyrophosphatase YjhB (NUDIX family)
MPSFGVVAAVLAEGRVVLQLREDAQMWNLPCGGVEPGESLAQATVREVREETGLEVQLTRLVGVYSRPRWRRGGDHQILFAATPVGGDLHQFDTAETLEARFFDPAALPDRLVWWHRRLIADAVSEVGSGVAWTLDAVWPFASDWGEVVEHARKDATFAERLRATFSALPAPEDERLDVGAPF